MIKRCPTCNRTYSDESISFCLADGALLSAPYDAIKEEPPATEILPSARAPVPPTEPPKPAVPTMTSLPGGANYPPFEVDELQPRRRQLSPLIWAAIAFVIVGAILIGIFGVRRVLNRQTETAATSTSADQVAQSSPSPTSNSESLIPISLPTPSNRPSRVGSQPETKTTSSPQTVQADPVLFPPETARPTPTPQAVDYDRIFRANEVDTRIRILEKPQPNYTESARKNLVSGTVVLRAVLSSTGTVTNISTIRGLPDGLTEQAIAAARRIRFTPAIKDGRQVSTWAQLEYTFKPY